MLSRQFPKVFVHNDLVVIDTGGIDVLVEEHIEYVQACRWHLFKENKRAQRVLNLFGSLRSLNLQMTPELFSYMRECTTAIAWVRPPAFLNDISQKYRDELSAYYPVKNFDKRQDAEDWLYAFPMTRQGAP